MALDVSKRQADGTSVPQPEARWRTGPVALAVAEERRIAIRAAGDLWIWRNRYIWALRPATRLTRLDACTSLPIAEDRSDPPP